MKGTGLQWLRRAVALLLLDWMALTVLTLVGFRLRVPEEAIGLLYLLAIVLISLEGHLVVSLLCTIFALLLFDYFFTPPLFVISPLDALDLTAEFTFATAAVVVTSLISRQRRMQRELAQARDHLEIEVAERTKELLQARDHLQAVNAELTKQSAQLEASNRELEALYRGLAQREAKIRRLVDANIVGIFTFALEGRIIEANDAFLKIVGHDREDLISGRLRWTDLTPPEWLDRDVRQLMPDFKRTGILPPFEKEYFRKDGNRVPVLIAVASFEKDSEHGESGEDGVAFVLDLTERKLAEEAWHEAQAQLAHVTRVATLGELAGSIAHEVNQPLTAIINNADACLALLPGEISKLDDVREALSDIISDADRASAVLARIRGLIKKSLPQKSRLDLNETIGGVIALARGVLDRNEVLLRTKLANDLPLIMGDRIHLQQVMLNLIINSIEAMSAASEGTRELWVSSEKVTAAPGESEQDGLGSNNFASPDTGDLEVERGTSNAERRTPNACILVSVADSGPGLDLNNVDRLFGPFYTTKPQGLGMGLSISRSIIEAHGGRLWARANVPKGALFQFTLPIAND